ncbi:DNA mismatch repair ATPase msh1 [Datura stramonium]|uniref:DNA mismatch repair ATPase msh1 n=1 Tax=Datura stramonium TaxID=4076 RepID=A0ABS8UY91_DATST|nr:DNA mismatch repair ATPase msh1 [Datura stramonium]
MEFVVEGRVKRIHLEEAYAEVEKAADPLSLAESDLFQLFGLEPLEKNKLTSQTFSRFKEEGWREWFTTMRVENAIARYHEASAKAKLRVLELLRGTFFTELQSEDKYPYLCIRLDCDSKGIVFSHELSETNLLII